MFIIKYKNLFIGLTAALVVACLFFVWSHGVKLGIDFTGGSVLEAEYSGTLPSVEAAKEAVGRAGIETSVVQHVGTSGIIIKMPTITDEQHSALTSELALLADGSAATSTAGVFREKQFNSIGPSIGNELRQKSMYAITMVILLIVLYITFAFRAVSRPVASWKYGAIAVITLLHDVAVPLGFVAFNGIDVDTLFVTAILAILGFSIHDTIIVFDRIRENLRGAGKKEEFAETVGKSLSQTFTRSINTSLTVVLVLVVLYLFGGESTHNFTLTLIVGIVAGTYSSLFFASPLLVQLYNWQKN